MQIFIAHAKEDAERAQKLKGYLETSIPGLYVFLSPYDLQPGDPMWQKTLRELGRSSALIALISRHYFHSNAREEVGYAFRIALERGMRIIPIVIDPEVASPLRLPAMISHLKALDFTRNPAQASSDLLRFLQQLKQTQQHLLLGAALAALLLFLWTFDKGE